MGPYHIIMAETCFLVFYVFELTLKLCVHRIYFFLNEDKLWNMLDFVLVGTSAAETALAFTVGGTNLTTMRLFRIFKFAKMLRVLRGLRFLRDLRLMLSAMLGSCMMLFWCFVAIAFIVFMFALFFVQVFTNYLATDFDHQDEEELVMIMKNFGSVKLASLSLLQAVTGGIDWADLYVLVKPTGTIYALCFVLYVMIFILSTFNVITALFLEKAMGIAAPDVDDLLVQKRFNDTRDTIKLKELFERIDIDADQSMSRDEFMAIMDDPFFVDFLALRGLAVHDAHRFFDMLQSIKGEDFVDPIAFVSGCLRMKGFATSIDLQLLALEVEHMHQKQNSFYQHVTQSMKQQSFFHQRLTESINRLQKDITACNLQHVMPL